MAWLLVAVCVGLLVVTALGIVGLASFWVQQRTKQIGIRRALGATRRQILRYFQTENLLLATIGIVLGMLGAYGLNQLLMGQYELPRLPALASDAASSSAPLACTGIGPSRTARSASTMFRGHTTPTRARSWRAKPLRSRRPLVPRCRSRCCARPWCTVPTRRGTSVASCASSGLGFRFRSVRSGTRGA